MARCLPCLATWKQRTGINITSINDPLRVKLSFMNIWQQQCIEKEQSSACWKLTALKKIKQNPISKLWFLPSPTAACCIACFSSFPPAIWDMVPLHPGGLILLALWILFYISFFLLQSQWKTQQHLTCTETTVHHGDQHRSTVSWKFMTASTCFLLLYVQIIFALKDRRLLLAYWSITNTSHNPMATHTPFQILFWMASLWQRLCCFTSLSAALMECWHCLYQPQQHVHECLATNKHLRGWKRIQIFCILPNSEQGAATQLSSTCRRLLGHTPSRNTSTEINTWKNIAARFSSDNKKQAEHTKF